MPKTKYVEPETHCCMEKLLCVLEEKISLYTAYDAEFGNLRTSILLIDIASFMLIDLRAPDEAHGKLYYS